MEATRDIFFQSLSTLAKEPESADGIEQLLGVVKKVNQSDGNANPDVAVSLDEFVQSLPQNKSNHIWSTLSKSLANLLETAQQLGAEAEPSEEDDEQDDVAQNEQHAVLAAKLQTTQELFLKVVEIAALLGMSWLNDAKRKTPTALVSVVQILHGLLFSLEEHGRLQTLICRLCEKWWLDDKPSREMLVIQLLPVLLIRSLEDAAKDVDIKRIYKLRDMFSLLDMQDESADTLKELLLRCFISPSYLRLLEGKRFLVSVLQLDPGFVEDCHNTVLSQLYFVQGKKSVVNAYAEVYFKAWRFSEGPVQATLELTCVQDIMDKAIFTADPKMAKVMLQLLNSGFHEKKNVRGVDPLLLKLYNSILWRALNVANATVRRNAANLLFHAFPLQDVDQPVSQVEALLERQYSLFSTLLKDPSSDVRVVAVQGVCRVLSLFWELIPVKTTTGILLMLVNELSHDRNSHGVRAAVFEGLGFVLENPISQGPLKEILPHLSQHIHDKSPAVRASFMKMLLRIKSVKTIKFYHVVQVDDILERLAIDQYIPTIADKMVSLLLPSFFPDGVSGSEQMKRILSLIKKNTHASFGFFRNLHRKVGVGQVCKLAMLCGKWIASQAVKDATMDRVTIGALQGIVLLWDSVSTKLNSKAYKPALEDMQLTFSFDKFVKPVFNWVQSVDDANEAELDMLVQNDPVFQHPKQSVLAVASMVDCGGSMDALRDNLVEEIVEHRPESAPVADHPEQGLKLLYTNVEDALLANLQCLCMWGKETTVLRHAVHALNDALTGSTKKRKKAGSAHSLLVCESEDAMHPLVAMWVIHKILELDPETSHNQARDRMLGQSAQVERLIETLGMSVSLLRASVSHQENFSAMDEQALFLMLALYMKLCVHKTLFESILGDTTIALPSQIHDLVVLCDDQVLAQVLEELDVHGTAKDATTPTKEPAHVRRRKRQGNSHTPSTQVEDTRQDISRFATPGNFVSMVFAVVADCRRLGMDVNSAMPYVSKVSEKVGVMLQSPALSPKDQAFASDMLECVSRVIHTLFFLSCKQQRGNTVDDVQSAFITHLTVLVKLHDYSEEYECLQQFLGQFFQHAPRGGRRFSDYLDACLVVPLLDAECQVEREIAESLKSRFSLDQLIQLLFRKLADPELAGTRQEKAQALLSNVVRHCSPKLRVHLAEVVHEQLVQLQGHESFHQSLAEELRQIQAQG